MEQGPTTTSRHCGPTAPPRSENQPPTSAWKEPPLRLAKKTCYVYLPLAGLWNERQIRVVIGLLLSGSFVNSLIHHHPSLVRKIVRSDVGRRGGDTRRRKEGSHGICHIDVVVTLPGEKLQSLWSYRWSPFDGQSTVIYVYTYICLTCDRFNPYDMATSCSTLLTLDEELCCCRQQQKIRAQDYFEWRVFRMGWSVVICYLHMRHTTEPLKHGSRKL